MIVFQVLFQRLHLKARLKQCFRLEVARLITSDLSFEEASRLIGDPRRERSPLPSQEVIDRLHRALDEGDDRAEIGRALLAARKATRHGCWLPLLNSIGINERRARRMMAAVHRPATHTEGDPKR